MTTRPVDLLDDRPAGLGRRLLAVLVDQVILLALGGGVVLAALVRPAVAGASTGTSVVPVPLLVVAVLGVLAVTVAQWLLHGRLGWTLGRRLLGVRTVDVHSRRPVGPGRVLLRGLVVAAGSLVPVVGPVVVLLSPLLDRTGRRRGWHDRAVNAEVLLVVRSVAPPRAGATAARGAVDVGAPPAAAPDRPAAAPQPRAPGTPLPPDETQPVPATPADGLVLAPLHPQRSGPDMDTRALPAVRTSPTLAFGLAPELELTRPAPPRADVLPEQPARTASAGLRVAFDDGRVVTVRRLALVGRNPSPAPEVQVVRVVDPARSVSKTHLQLAVDPTGGAWVVDRGSTNGTVVTLPDGAQVVCRVDHPVRLREGVVVAFGDRSLRVVAVPRGHD